MHLIEMPCILRLGQAHKDLSRVFRTLVEHGYKARYRLHRAGGANRDKDVAVFELLIDAVQFKRLLAKPAHIRTQQPPASASRQLSRRVNIPVRSSRTPAIGAARPEERRVGKEGRSRW